MMNLSTLASLVRNNNMDAHILGVQSPSISRETLGAIKHTVMDIINSDNAHPGTAKVGKLMRMMAREHHHDDCETQTYRYHLYVSYIHKFYGRTVVEIKVADDHLRKGAKKVHTMTMYHIVKTEEQPAAFLSDGTKIENHTWSR